LALATSDTSSGLINSLLIV